MKSKVILVLGMLLLAPGFAVAKDKAMMEEPSKESREKMAVMHEGMAACLRSDKKFSECRDQMMKSCPMMKDGKCPMMHHGHGGKKGGHHNH